MLLKIEKSLKEKLFVVLNVSTQATQEMPPRQKPYIAQEGVLGTITTYFLCK